MLYESRRSLWLALTAGFIAVEALGGSPLEAARRTIPVAAGLVLLPMIGRIVAVHREAVVTLAELAERDSLTGLLNRRGLDRRVRSMQGAPFVGLGVLYLDVDGFKAVNDRWGHDAGDELLRQIGVRLNAATRRDDAVARVGGDEFVVVVAGDRAVAAGVRDRVRRSTNDEPYALGGELLSASVSVGLSYTDSMAEPVASLISAADAGMFRAKGAVADAEATVSLEP